MSLLLLCFQLPIPWFKEVESRISVRTQLEMLNFIAFIFKLSSFFLIFWGFIANISIWEK